MDLARSRTAATLLIASLTRAVAATRTGTGLPELNAAAGSGTPADCLQLLIFQIVYTFNSCVAFVVASAANVGILGELRRTQSNTPKQTSQLRTTSPWCI